jgi:hypothetical protein
MTQPPEWGPPPPQWGPSPPQGGLPHRGPSRRTVWLVVAGVRTNRGHRGVGRGTGSQPTRSRPTRGCWPIRAVWTERAVRSELLHHWLSMGLPALSGRRHLDRMEWCPRLLCPKRDVGSSGARTQRTVMDPRLRRCSEKNGNRPAKLSADPSTAKARMPLRRPNEMLTPFTDCCISQQRGVAPGLA